MLRALLERDIVPDLVLGTSVGAPQRCARGREPDLSVVERLTALWQRAGQSESAQVYGDSALRTVRRAVSTKTHLWSSGPAAAGRSTRSSAT